MKRLGNINIFFGIRPLEYICVDSVVPFCPVYFFVFPFSTTLIETIKDKQNSLGFQKSCYLKFKFIR